MGSDIDGRQMRGKGMIIQRHLFRDAQIDAETTPGVFRAASQYGVSSKILDICTFDITNNPWRSGELFDAIVTDPPCKFSLIL